MHAASRLHTPVIIVPMFKVVVVGVGLAGCLIRTHPPAAPVEDASLGFTVSRYALANGLRVVVVKDPHASEVQVTMRVEAGGIDDAVGIAHFVEHLAYEIRYDGEPVFDRLAQIASYSNAHTSLDATTFVARAPRDRLGDLIAIDALRLGGCCEVDDAAFERERAVVLNELRERDAALTGAVREQLFPADHPYHRAVAGDISAITPAQVRAFVAAYYAPERTTLVVSGDVDRLDLHALEALPARAGSARPAIAAPSFAHGTIETSAPIDEDAVVFAWQLPLDPALQAKLRALLAVAGEEAMREISVEAIELGGERVPMSGFVATHGDPTALAGALDDTMDHLAKLFARQRVPELDGVAFARTKAAALYRLYARLANPYDRDAALARGDDGEAAIAALRAMDATEARALAKQYLVSDRARIVAVKAVKSPSPPPHETAPLVIEHHAVGAAKPPAITVPTQHTRTLANGMRVVLMPDATTPTVELRLVFAAGAADEPSDQRGVAIAAGDELGWDLRYVKDLLRFRAAGGTLVPEVGADRTTFSVHGLSGDLHVLLAGLRRLVREGRYEDTVGEFSRRVRRAQAERGDSLITAMREALFGAAHPYVKAGVLRDANAGLADEDVERFRRAHFTPDGATLVIAGRFDAALAGAWVDYLFADWRGHAAATETIATKPHPAAFAKARDATQVELHAAIPARAGGPAAREVVAEMLAELAGEIRLRLGASYGVHAGIVEARDASTYVVSGDIDAPRTGDALALLVGELAQLRAGGDAVVARFATARDHLLLQLARGGDARELAGRVIEGRMPAAEIAGVSYPQVIAAIAELDLSRGVVALQGPTADLAKGFAALGVQPVALAPGREEALDVGPNRTYDLRPYRDTLPRELVDPITSPSPRFRFEPMFAAGWTLATVESCACNGPSVAVDVDWAGRGHARVGAHLALAHLGAADDHTGLDISFFALDAAAYAQTRIQDRLWGGLLAGVHADLGKGVGPVFGGELGIDLIPLAHRYLGVFGRFEGVVIDGTSRALTVGLALHR